MDVGFRQKRPRPESPAPNSDDAASQTTPREVGFQSQQSIQLYDWNQSQRRQRTPHFPITFKFVHHVINPGPQLQLPTQTVIPDTAQAVWSAVSGDIKALKLLFSQGLASPRDESSPRGFTLVRVGLLTLLRVKS